MKTGSNLPPWRILLPAAIGTCLSLMGDASLYTVLPTHTVAAGVAVARSPAEIGETLRKRLG